MDTETLVRDPVEAWRLKCLVDAGFDYLDADLLAKSNADLHVALDMAANGCPTVTVANILL